MKQFKTYMKVAGAYKMPMLIYIMIFIIIEVLTYSSGALDISSSFESQSIPVWYVSGDTGHPVTAALLDYLGERTDLEDAAGRSAEELGDGLYFRDAEYIVTIPPGYGEQFFTENRLELSVQVIEGSYSEYYVQNLIDSFLSTLDTWHEVLPEADIGTLIAMAEADLPAETEVSLYEGSNDTDKAAALNQTFNLAAYSVMGCLMMGICFIMRAFYEKQVHRRILCSPVRAKSWNTSLFLSNFVLGLFIYLLLLVMEFILAGTALFSRLGLLLCLNLLLFVLVATTMAMLIVYLFPSRDVQIILANTLSLGFSFLGGCFVPQSLMGDIVNNVASFTPVHWYVKITNTLCQASSLNDTVISEMLTGFFIQLLFAGAFLAAALLIRKKKYYTAAEA